jgi:hypothetical protein
MFLAGKRTDPGVTNIRNVTSPHWRRWLDAMRRALATLVSAAGLCSGLAPWLLLFWVW